MEHLYKSAVEMVDILDRESRHARSKNNPTWEKKCILLRDYWKKRADFHKRYMNDWPIWKSILLLPAYIRHEIKMSREFRELSEEGERIHSLVRGTE